MPSFAEPPGGAQTDDDGTQTRNVQVNLGANVSQYSQQVGAAQAQTQALDSSVQSLTQRMGSLSAMAGKKLVHFSAADFAALGGAVVDAASLERQLGTLRATSAVTGSSMSAMKREIDNTFASFPIARGQVVALEQAIANLGVSGPRNIGAITNTSIKLGFATGESPMALGTGQVQLGRQMGNVSPQSIAGYSNALLTVSKDQGVAASGVQQFAQAIAPMARQAGIGEAAILGISAAFQKAGADGYYAANTFNQIISDITQLTQTGSPELAKYASFVGQSTAQFRSMSGTAQFTSIFEQLNRGGPQALQFLSSLGLGQRALTSVQAVAQSGSLQQAIAQAMGSSNSTANLDKASAAAMSGLANTVTDVRNQFTELGEKIGDPLLAPVTGLAKGFDAALGLVNKLVAAAQPLPAVLAAVGGAAAGIGGMALGHAGLVGTLALGRVALGRGSLPRVAFSEGRQTAQAIAGGMTRDEALALTETGRRFAARGTLDGQRLPLRASLPFMLAMQGGGGTGTLSRLLSGGRGAFAAGLRGTANFGAWVNEQNVQFLRDSSRSGYARSGTTGRSRANLRAGRVARRLARGAKRYMGETVYAAGSMGADLVGRAVRAGEPGAVRRGVAQAGFYTGRALGLAGRGIGALASGLFSFPGMIATMVGAPIVSNIINSIGKNMNAPYDRVGQNRNSISVYDQMLDKTSTNLARFSGSVDAAANKLSQFANLPNSQTGTVTQQDITAVTAGNYKIANPVIPAVMNAAGATGGRVNAGVMILQALTQENGSALTGDTRKAVMRDMLSALGGGKEAASTVNQIFAAFDKSVASGTSLSGTNFGTLGTVASKSDNAQFAKIADLAFSGIVAGTQDKGTQGQIAQLAQIMAFGGQALGHYHVAPGASLGERQQAGFRISQNQMSFAKELADLYGGNAQDYIGGFAANGTAPFTSPEAARKQLLAGFLSTDQGKKFLSGLPKNLQSPAALLNAMDSAKGLPPISSSDMFTLLRSQGALGRYAAGSSLFQRAATGNESGQPGTQFLAAEQLAGQAAKQAGGNLAEATANLTKLADTMGSADQSTGALIRSAAQWERTLASFKTSGLSQEGQLTTAMAQSAASQKLITAGATGDTLTAAQQDIIAGQAAQDTYRQNMVGKIQALHSADVAQQRAQEDADTQANRQRRDFQTQQQRADADYATQRSRAIQDFGVQQVRAEQDYDTQVLRAQQDFQTQRLRSQADYQLQVSRQTEDFHRQLAREAESSAQTIYDPFIREQAKATTDAGTLIYNLQEQNDDIERQVRQLGQLKTMGISQHTIDTLQLSQASNAQQVNTLLLSLQQNPNDVGQINALANRRVSDTTKLTQSPTNIAFRQQVQDFSIQMQRGQQDFATSQSRAAADQQRSMSRMAADYVKQVERASQDEYRSLDRLAADHALSVQRATADEQRSLDDLYVNLQTMQTRAAQDLLDSFKQYTGGFDSIFAELMNASAGRVAQYAPQVGNLIRTELDKLKADNPWITAPYGASAGSFHDSWNPNPQPYTPLAAPGSGVLLPGYKPAMPSIMGHYAAGGISLTQQAAMVSENGPELHLPLNATGQDFMAGLIAKSLAKGITMAVSSAPASQSVSTDNSISFAGADIVVQAQDPNAMAKALAAKAKLRRLVSPVRH